MRNDLRTMLIPKREITGESAVRADPQFHLCRAVDESSFGKAESHHFPVIVAVGEAREPSRHLVLARDRQGQHEQKFRPLGTGKLSRHVIGQHRDLAASIKFVRDFPAILAIVEGSRVGHMVSAVHLGLHREDIFRIADMPAQIVRHLACVLEEFGQLPYCNAGQMDRPLSHLFGPLSPAGKFNHLQTNSLHKETGYSVMRKTDQF
jgi:hypothetical protein